MNRIKTSMEIVKHSLSLIRQNGKLLFFPLFNVIGIIGILAFFALPLLFDTSIFSFSVDFPAFLDKFEQNASKYGDSASAPENFFRDHRAEDQLTIPFFHLLVLYLLSMVLLTFVNVAFYHEILQAFNGNRVLIIRGLGFACRKWRAILAWSLLAGVVGALIRKIEDHVGVVGRWITALIGISWSVASVFVVPVIVREQRKNNPIAYLKTSAAILKQTWGEGLVGMVSISGVLIVALTIALVAGVLLMFATMQPASLLLGLLAVPVLAYFSSIIRQIFVCGLYIYATEGVAPGSFDADFMNRAWRVKK